MKRQRTMTERTLDIKAFLLSTGGNMLPYIFILLFLAAAVLNLIGTKGHDRLFRATKPVLLLLLCLYCLFRGLPKPDLLLIGALFACGVGDILLMLKGDKWFVSGGVSFFIGHVLLILVFAGRLDTYYNIFYGISCLAIPYIITACVIMFITRKNTPKAMIIPMLLYLLCNGIMNAFALLCLIRSPAVGMRVPSADEIRQTVCCALSYAGAVLFFLSDCALFLMRYGGDKKRFYKTDFFVMLTYISGTFLITAGLVPLW